MRQMSSKIAVDRMTSKSWFSPQTGLEDTNELTGLCTCGAESERDRLRQALEDIAHLGPNDGEWEPWDDFDRADAFMAAQDRAREALATLGTSRDGQRAIAIQIEDECDLDD